MLLSRPPVVALAKIAALAANPPRGRCANRHNDAVRSFCYWKKENKKTKTKKKSKKKITSGQLSYPYDL